MKCGEPARAELLEYCQRLLGMHRRSFEKIVLRRYRPQPQPERDRGQDEETYRQECAQRHATQLAQVLDGNVRAYFGCDAGKSSGTLPGFKATLLDFGEAKKIEYKVRDVVAKAIYHEAMRTLDLKYVRKVSASGKGAKLYVLRPMESIHPGVDQGGNMREVNIPDAATPPPYEFELAEPPTSEETWAAFGAAWDSLNIRMRVGVFLRIQYLRGVKVSWDIDPVRATLAELAGKPKLSTYAIYALRDEAKRWLESQVAVIPFDQRRSHGLWMVRQIETWAASEKTCASLHSLPMKKTAS